MINILGIFAGAILWTLGILTAIIALILYACIGIRIYRYFKEEWKIKKEIKKNNNKE